MRRHLALLLLASTLAACSEMSARSPAVADAAMLPLPPAGLAEAASGGLSASIAPPSPAPAPTAPLSSADRSATPAITRQVIYTAALGITVPDIAAAESAVRNTAAALGGYLDTLAGNDIAIRVPAARFEDARAAIERLGQVTSRNLKADDITDQMRDLHIRLDNADQIRKQLQSLLAKSEKMDDTLKIEKELERVTEEIELLKGKIQYFDAQVAFSTLHVSFNSPHPQTPIADAVPFAWVRDLASGPIAGISEDSPDTSRLFHRNDRFKLPTGFVRYYEREHLTELLSADGCTIKMRRVDNYDGGTIDFWTTLAKTTLTDNRAIALSHDRPAALSDKTPAHLLTGTRDPSTGGPKQSYMLCLAATDRYVYAFEAWGPADKLIPRLPELEKSFLTLDARHW